MKKNLYWIALAAFIIPILVRGLMFYRGFPNQRKIATPDYQAFISSQPPIGDIAVNTNIEQTNGIILFDLAHANQYQPADVKSLQEAIEKRGGKVESISDATSLEYKLKYASALTVISPSTAFSSDEIRIIKAFVQRGGRLLVFTDATHGLVYTDFFSGSTISYPDTNLVNPLLTAFDISVNNDYLYNTEEHEGNFRNIFFESFEKNDLTLNLKRVALYGTHSIESPSGLVLLRGTEATLSSSNDAHDPASGGAVLSEDGNVLVFGDFTFLSSPYQNVLDNSTLIANIADFILAGKQKILLENFPFLFSQSVLQVYPAPEVQLTAEIISAISGLQTSLKTSEIEIRIATKTPRDGDVLVLGTFADAEELASYINPFNIRLDESGDTITLKNFGDIGRAGNGILLFEENKNGNRLTLLAETPEDLIALLSTVSSGSLYGCILQDNIGICSVGYGGSFFDETGGFGEDILTPEPATGDATPTPAG